MEQNMDNLNTQKRAINVCKNYRDFTLNCSLCRLHGKILTTLITDDYHVYQIQEQSGFRAGQSTTDNVFYLRQMSKKILATGS